MSSEVSLAEEIKEMKKWKVITFVALPFCVVKAAYDLSHGSHHGTEHPDYPYLHIRSKDFPWGPDGLFEVKHE
jgi:cytochrome c oxidase subunit 6a